jgi:hypothetical protein
MNMVIFKPVMATLSSLLQQRAAITQVFSTICHIVAVMTDIAGSIRAGGDLCGQTFFHQLADMELVGFGIGTFPVNCFGHNNSPIVSAPFSSV